MKKAYEHHGMRSTPTYKRWADMIQRCTNPKREQFAHYGAQGVTVCDRWRWSFGNFLADMGEVPAGMSLDRINVYQGYSPDNCRWADRRTQARNVRLRQANKSGIPGVWWDATKHKFKACISVGGKLKHLGHTADFFEACCLRKSAENKFFNAN